MRSMGFRAVCVLLLLFWFAPMLAEYEAIFPEGAIRKHNEWIRPALSARDAPLLDLDTDENRRDEYFWDVDHLGPGGSAAISRQLAARIRRLLAE